LILGVNKLWSCRSIRNQMEQFTQKSTCVRVPTVFNYFEPFESDLQSYIHIRSIPLPPLESQNYLFGLFLYTTTVLFDVLVPDNCPASREILDRWQRELHDLAHILFATNIGTRSSLRQATKEKLSPLLSISHFIPIFSQNKCASKIDLNFIENRESPEQDASELLFLN
jgi:hypothetical protein